MTTIFAMSSGQPPSAIAVVRISGPEAAAACRALSGKLPAPRMAVLRRLVDPADDIALDQALILWLPGPASATGEDVCEFHLHGGRAVVAAVLGALSRLPGLRPAEPGEFTRRALMNGRIDLAEAEGLGDLLQAETEAQRRRALSAVSGSVTRAVAGWSSRILDLSATVESMLDFSDEDDVGEVTISAVRSTAAGLAGDIARVLATPAIERLRDGIAVVLAGPPNSGKSTLLNALVERDAAIVSPIAGTTRDRIEAAVIRDGIAYRLTDTAGLAETTDDPIERIGITRAREAIEAADIILWLGDDPPRDPRALWLWPRADIRGVVDNPMRLPVAALAGEGLSALWSQLAKHAAGLLPREDQLALNARQRDLCRHCLGFLQQIATEEDLLIIADLLRCSRDALDRITGASDVEAMLDSLFGRFCIGK